MELRFLPNPVAIANSREERSLPRDATTRHLGGFRRLIPSLLHLLLHLVLLLRLLLSLLLHLLLLRLPLRRPTSRQIPHLRPLSIIRNQSSHPPSLSLPGSLSPAGCRMRFSSGLAFWAFSAALSLVGSVVVVSGHSSFHGGGGAPSNPWEAFRNFSGCHLGENRTGLADLKRYLRHFGYLPNPSRPSNCNLSDAFDESLREAILAYQRNFRLNATGFLDPSTVDLMAQPRCGIADVVNGTAYMRGRGLYSYFPGRPKWPSHKTNLTYAITSTAGVSASDSVLRGVFSRAFSRWSEVTTLTFAEVDAAAVKPDITIGFFSGDHGDGEGFDGTLGTLAHAFSPPDGRLHLDAEENWVADGDVTASSSWAVDLESVVVHEIGHLLGLGHSSVEEAIMYPTIRIRTKKVLLADDDVRGIQSLYGSNPSYNASTTAASPTDTVMQERDSSGARPSPAAVGWTAAVGGLLVAAAAPLLVL